MAEIFPHQGTESQWIETLLFLPISEILSLSFLGNCGRPRLDDLGLKKDRLCDLSSQTWSRIDWRRDSSSEPLIQYRKYPLILSKCLSPSSLFVKYLAERPRSLLGGWSFFFFDVNRLAYLRGDIFLLRWMGRPLTWPWHRQHESVFGSW